jgi:cobalt-precorrin 5A hydrolase/precorrin-3B C17-methyltransferase
MAITPIVIALNASGIKTARKLATAIGAEVHGREGRVLEADAWFGNALDHIRDLFAAGVPIIGVCASGILIRAVAPLLNDKSVEPPVVSISDDGAVVVPLLGGHRGANRLARDIAQILGSTAAVTTAGDVSLGVSLDEPPVGWALVNHQDAKAAMSELLAGGGASVLGD